MRGEDMLPPAAQMHAARHRSRFFAMADAARHAVFQ